MAPPEITNSRRILLVGPPSSGKLAFLRSLTGSLPPATGTTPSHAGLSHSLQLKTPYYTATVPIWIDEVECTPEASAAWADGYLKEEAKEVLKVLGAFIFTFRKPQDTAGLEAVKRALKALQRVVKGCGYAWDGVCLAVAMPQSLQPRLELGVEQWEDLCREFQFEHVDFEFKGRNEYGEPAGMERVLEALEANDWGGDDMDDAGSFGSFEDGDEEGEGMDPLRLIGDEMGREMFGLHNAIFGDEGIAGEGSNHGETDVEDEEAQVEKLEAMMATMAALKDIGGDLSKEERRKVAAKALSDIMKSPQPNPPA